MEARSAPHSTTVGKCPRVRNNYQAQKERAAGAGPCIHSHAGCSRGTSDLRGQEHVLGGETVLVQKGSRALSLTTARKMKGEASYLRRCLKVRRSTRKARLGDGASLLSQGSTTWLSTVTYHRLQQASHIRGFLPKDIIQDVAAACPQPRSQVTVRQCYPAT